MSTNCYPLETFNWSLPTKLKFYEQKDTNATKWEGFCLFSESKIFFILSFALYIHFCWKTQCDRVRSFHPKIMSPHIISPQVHFTPNSFHTTFISPQIDFTPHLNYQMRLRLITKATQFQS